VDRCALFVDAGYVLADGAMAVHGTRRGESVSWDYEGLLQLLSSLARERSGLPLLRCYWYEATVDGRRTAEHDALADVPGVKLRVAKIRPGRREGVETEIHRDLTTLARNNAISDALVVSAEEDLTQVIADVQDLGLRVTLVHIAVDGNWTISRALRQESDDILEIGGEHLGPYVELIAGAEPVHEDEAEGADHAAARPLANGHSLTGAGSYQPMPAAANHAPPAIYTAPVVAEYQRPALQLPRAAAREDRTRDERARDERARDERTRDDRARDERTRDERTRDDRARDERTRDERTRDDRARDERTRDERARDERAREDRTVPPAVNGEAPPAARLDPPAARPDLTARPDIYAGPVTTARGRPERPDRAETVSPSPAARVRTAEEAPGYGQGPQGTPEAVTGGTGPEPIQSPPGQLRRLPSSRTQPSQPSMGPMGGQGPGGQGPAPMPPGQQHGVPGQGSSRSAPYSGPQPVMAPGTPSYPSAGGVSLSEAVQAAHEEGQEFGASVARDAPALWLEAVLARKPRMPSDLEARLLQGSALPIDFLLHDEVRHALRRGFWDALERTRR
jgi:uncharacterized LabA/DUF88 family protein